MVVGRIIIEDLIGGKGHLFFYVKQKPLIIYYCKLEVKIKEDKIHVVMWSFSHFHF